MCSQCAHREPYVPSDWFSHIMYLYRLQRGGYPFTANDLDVAEWLALGEMADLMDVPRMP